MSGQPLTDADHWDSYCEHGAQLPVDVDRDAHLSTRAMLQVADRFMPSARRVRSSRSGGRRAGSGRHSAQVRLLAMSRGLPVVATGEGGTEEILDRSSGELVEPGSEQALADAIYTVVSARASYDPASVHRTAGNRYGYGAVARSWTEIYDLAATGQETRAARRSCGL